MRCGIVSMAMAVALLLGGCAEQTPTNTVPSKLSGSAASPPPAPGASPLAPRLAPTPAAAVSGAVDLVLVDAGDHVNEVRKVLFGNTELQMPQIRAMLDELPVTVLSGVSRGKAEYLQKQLEAAGAKTEIK